MLKLSKASNVVVNFSAATCSAAKAAMLLHQHRTCVGCDEVSEMMSVAEPDVLLTIVSQMLSPESDISERGKAEAAAKGLADETNALLTT